MPHFVCALLILLPLVSFAKTNDQNEQIKFITNYYRGYLDTRGEKHVKFEKDEPLFSRSALQAIEHNKKVCAEKSRGDDICGYGADGDVFLNAQEIGPDLKFSNSKFKAKSIGKDKIEVSFNVYPGEAGTYYERKIIFKLVKEDSSWRVADLISATMDSNGKAKMESMIDAINAENANYEKEARDLSNTWSWIQIYLGDTQFLDRASKFVRHNISICQAAEKCKIFDKNSNEVLEAFKKVNAFYGSNGAEKSAHSWPGPKDFGKKDSVSPKAGTKVDNGPFRFEFKDNAWWLEQIDFNKMK